MIGVSSVYPFGVVIWQDVSNMSCKDGMLPQCATKVHINLQLSKLLVLQKCDFSQNLFKLRAKRCFYALLSIKMSTFASTLAIIDHYENRGC